MYERLIFYRRCIIHTNVCMYRIFDRFVSCRLEFSYDALNVSPPPIPILAEFLPQNGQLNETADVYASAVNAVHVANRSNQSTDSSRSFFRPERFRDYRRWEQNHPTPHISTDNYKPIRANSYDTENARIMLCVRRVVNHPRRNLEVLVKNFHGEGKINLCA